MILALLVIYPPWVLFGSDHTLEGADYDSLHERRLQYAQQSIFSSHPRLPGWYSREALGTPFWSNIQNFPFIPTRLILLAFDPRRAFAVGVILAASLAAIFTFLYCAKLGMGRLACAVAAWTFASSGYFASRVHDGHLPLLEAYPGLPLLLFLVESYLRNKNGPRRIICLLAIGLSTTFLALAGHPQLPIYALAVTTAYILWRARFLQAVKILAASALGAAMAGFVLWPFLLLVARSNRILPLDPPANDVVFPLARLATFVVPSHSLQHAQGTVVFDTVCYVGWLPLLAALLLLLRWLFGRKLPDSRVVFLGMIGLLALALACVPSRVLFAGLHVTAFRSPARLIYITTFALAIGLGAAIELVTQTAARAGGKWPVALIALALGLHVFDLANHDQFFISSIPLQNRQNAPSLDRNERVAIDWYLSLPSNRQLDDIGFFDSIVLARSYTALLELAHVPPSRNYEILAGSVMDARALAACGVDQVITARPAPQLGSPLPVPTGMFRVIRIPNPAPRAKFYPPATLLFLDRFQIHQRLGNDGFDLQKWLMLPNECSKYCVGPSAHVAQPHVDYWRNSPDVMTIDISTTEPGFLRVLEAWDPGWSATVDGAAAPTVIADEVFMAVPIPAGKHRVVLQFSTPGVAVGATISLISLGLLLLLVLRSPRRARAVDQ